jgi:hypothetical protein
MLLRLVHGNWPPELTPTGADEIAEQELVNGYDAWMVELRGLSASTREHARTETRQLLRWLRDHGKSVASLCVADLDAYIAARGVSMRRTSKVTMISTLRGVLRYLHGCSLMPTDLVGALQGPPIYALEGIPSTIRREDIERALEAARRDHSPLGRRDYAILMWPASTTLSGVNWSTSPKSAASSPNSTSNGPTGPSSSTRSTDDSIKLLASCLCASERVGQGMVAMESNTLRQFLLRGFAAMNSLFDEYGFPEAECEAISSNDVVQFIEQAFTDDGQG